MKKYISILALGLSFMTIQAQDVSDAVRLAQTNLTGTARFAAMSGAFGALGGDMSAVSINPAGSVIFANNQATVTLGNFNTSNSASYFGNKTNRSDNNLDLNQAGGVFVFDNYSKSDWKKFAIAVNYENGQLDNKTFAAGINPTNSIDRYFLNYANANAFQGGIPLSVLNGYYLDELNFADQQAYLGYYSYIIEPTSTVSTNTSYYTNVSQLGGNFNQQNSIVSNGYNGKLVFNAAAQYQNWLSIGLSLNSHFTDYRQTQQFVETNKNPKYATGSTVDNIIFNNELYTFGTGFSFQTGAIIKASKEFRFGLAYESPTWYDLNDEFTQSVFTRGFGLSSTPNPAVYGSKNVDEKVINVYDPYSLRTPSKWTTSIAYVFGKKGLFSVDYSKKNYGKTQFGPEDQFTRIDGNNANNDIRSFLTSSRELRLGGEYKIKQWSLRGGYRFEESPYKNKAIMGDLKGYSAGLGYNWGATRLDLAYSRTERESQRSFFNRGLTDNANYNTIFNNITATIVFEL